MTECKCGYSDSCSCSLNAAHGRSYITLKAIFAGYNGIRTKKMNRVWFVNFLLTIALIFNFGNLIAKTPLPKPLVTFIELGSVNCVPCKMMKPVMKEVEDIYGDKVEVIFYDVWKPEQKQMSAKYKVRVIPTQVFLDKDGKEFFRHEGFYPKDEMVKMLDKQMGITRKPVKK